MNGWESRVGRWGLAFGVAFVGAVVGLVVFVGFPDDLADLLGVVFVIVTVAVALRIGSQLAAQAFPPYNVAEVAVEGLITRDGGGRLPRSPVGTSADDVVEQIDRADEDDAAQALLLRLNTPGGQVVPSEDIRLAAERFDGPTIAYATDTCASGGYAIASGCDELWAREGSIVGSIGVIGSHVNAAELADRLGLEYVRLAAGEYKDAGTPLKELEPDERAYLQGIVDDFYETFLDHVAEGRGMDRERLRETEARVYLGAEAHELGLVDELGTREDVEDHLAEQLDEPIAVQPFEPERGVAERLRGGAATLAYSFGAGVASALGTDRGVEDWQLRV